MDKAAKLNIEEGLTHLLRKYEVEPTVGFGFENKRSGDYQLSFVSPSELRDKNVADSVVPLLYWRSKRKYIELKDILKSRVVEDPCLFRFSHINNEIDSELMFLLYRELDLVEYITGQRIISVSAVLSGNISGNILCYLENKVIGSIEVSRQMPENTPPIERHEIIGRRGSASDTVVDTQITQHSIYLFAKDKEEEFTDYDMELFNLPNFEKDFIRSAFMVIQNPTLIDASRSQHRHLMNLIDAVNSSDSQKKKINL
jgi:hypothetical protein